MHVCEFSKLSWTSLSKEWKARFIALGHLVITASGEAPAWDEVYLHTAGFPLIRLCIVYAMAVKGICVIADLLGAYLHVCFRIATFVDPAISGFFDPGFQCLRFQLMPTKASFR